MRTSLWLERFAVIGFLVALTLLVLVPASPLFQKLPSWDSGIFMYTGWRITLGELLYRDVWDHKPPLIFLINGAGVLLGNGSRWGVWLMEFVSMLAAALLGFSLIRRAFGVLPAVYASVAWMINAFVTMDGGNYTTEYGLPLQFGLLWLVATAPDAGVSPRRAFVLGILSSLLFWLRQNDIGIPLAIVLLLAVDFMRGARVAVPRAFAAMAGGAVLISLLFILPFAFQNVLAEFWDGAFRYNLEYIDETWFDRLVSLRFLPITIPSMGLATLAFVGWLIGVLAFLNGIRGGSVWTRWSETLNHLWGERTKNRPHDLSQVQAVRLLTLVIIALPIEVMLVTLSANGFDHYFLALLPVLAVLAAFTFRILIATLERAALATWVRVAFVVTLVGLLMLLSTENVRAIYNRISTRENNALIGFILANSDPHDRVLIWGGETRVNYQTKRAIPMRFLNLGPLRSDRESIKPRLRSAMTDLREKIPRFIIGPTDSLPLLSEFSAAEPEVAAAAQEFMSQYEIRDTVGEWTVYEFRAP